MAQKAVELILMRQLASYLAVPIFLVEIVPGTEGLSIDLGDVDDLGHTAAPSAAPR